MQGGGGAGKIGAWKHRIKSEFANIVKCLRFFFESGALMWNPGEMFVCIFTYLLIYVYIYKDFFSSFLCSSISFNACGFMAL